MPEPVEEAVRATVEEHVGRAGKRVGADELAETVRRAARRKANDVWGRNRSRALRWWRYDFPPRYPGPPPRSSSRRF